MTRTVNPVPQRLEARRRVDENGCWNWTGFVSRNGYGQVRVDGRIDGVHRVAYACYVGPIGDGLVIDHLRRNRTCFNPSHLEAVTNAENVRRGEGCTAANARKTHCKRGHEFTPENTRQEATGRRCKRCQAEHQRKYDQGRRAERNNEVAQ